jgi:phosphonate transport system substrate-binding protein
MSNVDPQSGQPTPPSEPYPAVPSPPSLPPGPVPVAGGNRRFPVVTLLILLALLAVGGAAFGGYYYYLFSQVKKETPDLAAQLRLTLVVPTKLADDFTDADNDLVADPPKDTDRQLDPDKLVFTVLDRDEKVWKEFIAHLEKKTGKKVVVVAEKVAYPEDDIKDFKDGKIHLAALSTGTVPTMVNRAGYVPVCAMARADGTYSYEAKILVAADSPVRSLQDLRGKSVGVTTMRSLSSYKLPVMVLWQEGLRPYEDYEPLALANQDHGVKGVASGSIAATTVANDYLKRILKREKLDESRFRTVYKSKSFPPACFGYNHRLKRDFADKVRDAFLQFEWKKTGLEESYGPAEYTHFAKVDYKKDWEPVRRVDEEVNKLFQEQAKAK